MRESIALAEPDTGAVRYIGRAGWPQTRVARHIQPSSLKVDNARTRGLKGLIVQGVKPSLLILDVIKDEEAEEAERRWMRFSREQGAQLTNIYQFRPRKKYPPVREQQEVSASHV